MLNNLLILLMLSIAYADEGKFTLLGENEPAPFEGVLFNPIATSKLLSEHSIVDISCDLEVEYHLDIQGTEFKLQLDNAAIRYESLEAEHNLMIEQKDLEIVTLQEALKKHAPSNKWFWYVGGIASGVAISYGTYRAFDDQK
jgi:hypothetical protein